MQNPPDTQNPPPPRAVAAAPGASLLTLLASFRREAQRRGSHGRDFILGCVENVALQWRQFQRRCAAQADAVAAEVTAAEAEFETIVADGIVTDAERRHYRATLACPSAHAAALAQTLRETA